MACCRGKGLVDHRSSSWGAKVAHVPTDNVDVWPVHLFLKWPPGREWAEGSVFDRWWWLGGLPKAEEMGGREVQSVEQGRETFQTNGLSSSNRTKFAFDIMKVAQKNTMT